jgi:hypothetical protein
MEGNMKNNIFNLNYTCQMARKFLKYHKEIILFQHWTNSMYWLKYFMDLFCPEKILIGPLPNILSKHSLSWSGRSVRKVNYKQ